VSSLGRIVAPGVHYRPRRVRGLIAYEIRDAAGDLVAIHERHDGPDGSKRFTWRRPDRTVGLNGTPIADLPLYGIDQLGAESIVVIVEGEKSRDALAAIGISAVATVTGASSTPGRTALAELTGRSVVVWADADDIGLEHMRRTVAGLEKVGAASVAWIGWLDAPPHGDAADFLAAGGTHEDIVALIRDAGVLPIMASRAERSADPPAIVTMEPRMPATLRVVAGRDGQEAPVDLAAALADTVAHLRRFVYFTDELQAVAVALWVAHTHAVNAAEQSPILAFMSAVRRSGKSRAMEAIEPIVARPWRAVRPSEAVFFRRIDRDQPAVLLDEVDTIFNAKTEHEGIRACLNSGNRPGTTIPRAVAKGKGFDLVDFRIYCAKALAGIGELPETVRDRTIVIHMTRKAPGDAVERLRARDASRLGRPIGDALARALAGAADLTLPDGDLPDELDDRAQDGWEPLLAIARLAGGTWPQRARAAAVALSSERGDVEDDSLGMVLLRDTRTAFGEDRRLTTSQLIERLCAIELSPWGDFYGKSVSGRRIAKLLRPFGIQPHRERAGTIYARSQFVDGWSRYLPPETAETAGTAADEHDAIPPSARVAVSAHVAASQEGDTTGDLMAAALTIFGDDLADPEALA
jgi:hypothetical protein